MPGIAAPTPPLHPPQFSCNESSIGFTRADLTQMLIDEARSRYPGLISFHFNSKLGSVDLDTQRVTFEAASSAASGGGEGGRARSFGYDLLIGADGETRFSET